MNTQERAAGQAPPALMPLIRALADLKRVRSAGRAGSVAERLFASAWAQVAAGEDVDEVARTTTAAALAATVLGDLAADVARGGYLPVEELEAIARQVTEEVSGPLDPALRAWIAEAEPAVPTGATPAFVAALAAQPRAGVTAPGRGRILFDPTENHAEHCLLVAVAGVVLSPAFGARPETVFLAGLAHHLHNATLADAGFAGEVALGDHLVPVFERATAAALAQLHAEVRARVEAARAVLPDAWTPEGQAFHAADTLDRVLQVEHHLRAAGTSMGFVLREMELVHEGPVRPFQMALLRRMGLDG